MNVRRFTSGASSSDTTQPGAQSDDWKLYTSSSGAYQIAYPVTAIADESVPGALRFDFHDSVDAGANQAVDEFSFKIVVVDNPQDLSPVEWVTTKGTDEGVISKRSQKQVTISGRPGYEVSVFGYDQSITQVYVAAAGKMYTISYWDPATMIDLPGPTREMYKTIFDRMVRSFKLL